MKPITVGIGQLKQQLAKEYQEAYLEIFEFGSKNQRIEIIGDKLIFFSSHKRMYAMKALDGKIRQFTRMMDILLIDEFKERLNEKLTTKYGFQILTILQDYDPRVELAVSVVVLDRDLSEYMQAGNNTN